MLTVRFRPVTILIGIFLLKGDSDIYDKNKDGFGCTFSIGGTCQWLRSEDSCAR
ncbi:hypothetical protein KL86SPO_30816 [uncultured Sporomusa sp.]|uniref:Uncharacterized protein n=1 Tax=uncultured Sporomusa sp. TaxID=307249 RepID=A0A212LSV6_9FIRM|nr:hypothetical protein KL86SPO_30816 [uncultured Sporomusa sp.]